MAASEAAVSRPMPKIHRRLEWAFVSAETCQCGERLPPAPPIHGLWPALTVAANLPQGQGKDDNVNVSVDQLRPARPRPAQLGREGQEAHGDAGGVVRFRLR